MDSETDEYFTQVVDSTFEYLKECYPQDPLRMFGAMMGVLGRHIRYCPIDGGRDALVEQALLAIKQAGYLTDQELHQMIMDGGQGRMA